MLIVEGTDGVGKTTLCHHLVDRLKEHGPWIYSHLSKPPLKWHFPTSYFPRMTRFVVQDRHHMSEIVYRQAREEPRALTPMGYKLVDARLRQLGGFTIVIVGTEAIIRRNHKGDGDMHDVNIHLKANHHFRRIVMGQWEESIDWNMWWDLHKGWPEDWWIDQIIDKYTEQQAILEVWKERMECPLNVF